MRHRWFVAAAEADEAAGSLKRLGIFTATRWELNAVCRAVSVEKEMRLAGSRCVIGGRGNCRLYTFQTGVGTARAGAVCREALAAQPFDLVVSSGFACALTPSRIGDLLVGTDVIMLQNAPPFAQTEAVSCGERPRAMAIRAARDADLALHEGRVVTLSRVLWRAEEKRRVAEATGAVGLDMESAALGRAAVNRQVPFAVVRAASDLLDEDLPLDFNLFLSQSGGIGMMGWLRGAGQCLARPSRLAGLNRLRRQSTVASARITGFFERFLDEFE
ncbi:MAG: hypothetical protein FJ249_09675 [Nitrospira sp.]|nr:hypothetical protein [Nitrospira sp.]